MSGREWSIGYVDSVYDIGCSLEYEYEKRPHTPLALNININNIGSYRCGRQFRTCKPGESGGMDWALFTKVIDDFAKSGGEVVGMCPHCEPFALPEAVEYVRYVSLQGLKLYFETDMRYLNESMLDAMVNFGMDAKFKIYFDGIFEETYRKSAGFSSWESICNIKNLKRKYDNIMYIHSLNHNFLPFEQDVTEFYWNYNGIAVECEGPHNWAGAYDTYHKSKMRIGMGCPELLNGITVDVDGSVLLCTMDVNVVHRLGDLNTMSIGDVWNSRELKDITADVYKRAESGRDILCNRCHKVCIDSQKN